jgi:hypothetical protein
MGKNWFNFEFSDDLRSFFTQKDVLKKFAELRSLENELDQIDEDLNKIPAYKNATTQIDKLNLLKIQSSESEKAIPETSDRINELNTEIKEELEKMIRLLS